MWSGGVYLRWLVVGVILGQGCCTLHTFSRTFLGSNMVPQPVLLSTTPGAWAGRFPRLLNQGQEQTPLETLWKGEAGSTCQEEPPTIRRDAITDGAAQHITPGHGLTCRNASHKAWNHGEAGTNTRMDVELHQKN